MTRQISITRQNLSIKIQAKIQDFLSSAGSVSRSSNLELHFLVVIV